MGAWERLHAWALARFPGRRWIASIGSHESGRVSMVMTLFVPDLVSVDWQVLTSNYDTADEAFAALKAAVEAELAERAPDGEPPHWIMEVAT